jgi:hypothetical protein
MKRKLIPILLASLLLTGCSSNLINPKTMVDSPNSKIADFEIIDNNFYSMILVDKNTNVLYYWITANAGGITPIYNSDGTLKFYEE